MHGLLKTMLILGTVIATVVIGLGVPTLIGWITEGPGLFPRIAAFIYLGCLASCAMAVYQTFKENYLQVPGYAFFGLCVPATAFQVGVVKMVFPWFIEEFPFSFRHDLTPNNPDFVRFEFVVWGAFFALSALTYATIRTNRPWEKNSGGDATGLGSSPNHY